MRKFLFILAALLCTMDCVAQGPPTQGPVVYQNYTPTGLCSLPNFFTIQTSGAGAGAYQCIAGTWTVVGGGSSLSLTTTGTSGAATYSGGVLNIPNYSLAQVYPGAGVANSTGSAWGTSFGTSGTGTTLALTASPVFVTPTLGVALATSVNGVALSSSGSSALFLNQSGGYTAPAWTNITGSVTPTGCTVSGGSCAVSGTTTTAVTFASIPGTGNRLQIVVWGGGSSNDANVNMTFNGDTAAHYAYNGYLQFTTTSPTANDAVSATACGVGQLSATNTSQTIADIPFYAVAAFGKMVTSASGAIPSTSSASANLATQSTCNWDNGGTPAAITSITMTAASGHFLSGSQFMILMQN
jgi:hypothetical protein